MRKDDGLFNQTLITYSQAIESEPNDFKFQGAKLIFDLSIC